MNRDLMFLLYIRRKNLFSRGIFLYVVGKKEKRKVNVPTTNYFLRGQESKPWIFPSTASFCSTVHRDLLPEA